MIVIVYKINQKLGDMKLTNEQIKKAATMMLESAEYCKTMAGPTVFIPSIHTEKDNREENLRAITAEVAELVRAHGTEIDQEKLYELLHDHLLKDAYMNVSEETLESLRAKYQTAPIYLNRKDRMVTLYCGLWSDGIMEKLNLMYIDDYKFTNHHADKERMEQQMQRRRDKQAGV